MPGCSTPGSAGSQIQQAGFTTVGLLGSRYTMTGTYFTGRLHRRYGLNVLVAEGEHQDNVHNALYAELARAAVLPTTRAKFQAAITDLVARGAEVIILACTEFGMLVQAQDSPVPVIDTTIATPRPPSRWHWLTSWITPGILEALIPGRIQGHGGTAEVSGGAA